MNNPAIAAGTAGAGVTLGQAGTGDGWICDASATGYINLASSNRFLNTTDPFTIAWCEHHSGTQTNAGVLNLFPSGGTPATRSFMILRTNQVVLGPALYGPISWGPWTAAGVSTDSDRLTGSVRPPIISKNIPLVFVLTGTGGVYSSTRSDYKIYWASQEASSDVVSGWYGADGELSGNNAAFGATQNYFGWDNIDNKWSGLLDNLRIWNRVLDIHEIQKLLRDPYFPCAHPQPLVTFS